MFVFAPLESTSLMFSFRLIRLYSLLLICFPAAFALADGPRDNQPDQVRQVPPAGVEVAAEDRQAIEAGLSQLKEAIGKIRGGKNAEAIRLLPDVEIFHRAVATNLEHAEFFSPNDVKAALRVLEAGQHRAAALAAGKSPWTTQTGLVVRGFRSRLDGTVQPYGLVIPPTYEARGPHGYRLDLWFHGRGETLSETKFIDGRMRSAGIYTPANAFVLHPYGRYSNAFKFAGEIDVLEALEHAQANYHIDEDRIAARGFSMGGAACWQFAVHYSDRWFAANPGAGFSETPEFLKFFQKETLDPPWYEEKLWRWYDCNGYAANLQHCPTVAYSGELDIQKQAADIMEAALAEQGIDMLHIIGPQTKHAIHADSRKEIERRMASLAAVGRDRSPRQVHLTTYTLKYNQMHWLTLDALETHWEKAAVDAQIVDHSTVKITAANVTALSLNMPSGECPFSLTAKPTININGQSLAAPQAKSDRSWSVQLHRQGKVWKIGPAPVKELVKRQHLQGPIDDAFMDSFVMVRPTGKPLNDQVGDWAQGELKHAVEHWRTHFRGDARVTTDQDLSDAQIAESNLILFGDPFSNAVIAKIIDDLPLTWTKSTLQIGADQFDPSHHAAVLIYPNPLNPDRYIVLNSGFTFREYDYLNNARQTAKLPDWAIIDLRTPPHSRGPGKVAKANFFGESWQVK